MKKIVPGLTNISVKSMLDYLGVAFSRVIAGEDEAQFSASGMSEGALRALGILVAAAQMTRDELLIVEEPEQGVHPGAARVLFEALKEASQTGSVLLSTHSPELLDAAKDEEILVAELRDGATQVGPLAEAQRALIRDGLFTVSELFRAGDFRIEGLPPITIATAEH